MKIKINKLHFTKKSYLLVLFFACMFVFASFTREDRQKIRELKKELMNKLADKKNFPLNDKVEEEKSFTKESSTDIPQIMGEGNKSSERLGLKNEPAFIGIYSSKEKEGIIGVFSDKEEDMVSDNFFTVDIPAFDRKNTTAFLEYELFGLASHESVSRSINHNVSIGGGIIVPNGQWSHQRERLSADLILTGTNTILFTSPAAGVKYKIKNLKLVFEQDKEKGSRPNISSILSGDQLYVKGNNIASSTAIINNKQLEITKGEFEKVIRLSEKDKKAGMFSIVAAGISNAYKIPAATSSFKITDNSYATPKGISVTKNKEFNVSYENANILIEKETSESAYLEILRLREKDFPAISQGIKNVTLNNNAYRFSVLSGKLEKKVKITIPYDQKRLGLFSPKEIKVFHFDYHKKQWIADNSVVDAKNKTVTVEGNGDNDYINGIISVPESPQTNSFSPTSISGLKAADPMDGMQLMSPPTGGQKGDANLNYPVNVPAGLGGIQPSVSIGYSSSGGNGWMGEGWDMQGLSSITVDTRWGTPAFDPSSESELYSMDGEMLVYPNGYLPHRHNNVSETSHDITTARQARTAGIKQFYLRKNHDFTKIERNGTGPGDYSWTVTSTNGMKSYYGGSTDSVIKDADGKIVHWGLRMIADVHGNTMALTYQNNQVDLGPGSNINGGTYFHIRKITYGKNQDYAVTFNTESGVSRKDISINAKQGVKRVEPYLLNNIVVSYKTSTIRTYHLEYEEGQFSKTRLKRLYIKVPRFKDPTTLPVVDDYSFEYYNEIENNKIFGPDTPLQVNNMEKPYTGIIGSFLTPSKINGNISSENGLNFRAAAGLNFYTPSNDAYGHLMFGFPFGYSTAEAKNAQQLIDFNGDGIQDMIYRLPNKGLYFSQGILSESGVLSFQKATPILNFGNEFSFTKTKTNNLGWDMGAAIYSKSEIKSTSTGTTSTYLIDANSDGLVDIVNNDQVWFNRFNQGLKTPEMTRYSEFTENMVVKAKPPAPPITAPPGPKDPPIIAPEDPPVPITDIVKFWIAPKDGYVTFNDDIIISSLSGEDDPRKVYYSVEIRNPDYVQGGTMPDNFTNARIYLTGIKLGEAKSVFISRYNDYYSEIQGTLSADTQSNRPGGINNSGRLFVKSGDKIYVRLHKNIDYNLEVSSNPVITYVDPVTGSPIANTPQLSQDQFQLNNGNYGNNFFMNSLAPSVLLDGNGTANITVNSVNFPYSTDNFTFKVIKEEVNTGNVTVLHSQDFVQSDIPFNSLPFSTSISVSASQPVYLKSIVESDSHLGYIYGNWNSAINVNYTTTSPTGSSITVKHQPVAQYPSFAVTQFKEKIDIKNSNINPNILFGSHNFGVQVNKNISSFSNLGTGNFYYVIKKGNKVLGKRMVTVVSDSASPFVSETEMPSGQVINGVQPIEFFTGDLAFIGDTDHEINIQVYCKTGGDYALFNNYAALFQGKPFNVYYDAVYNVLTPVTATSVNTAMYNTKSAISNNWGQFIYKPDDYTQYTYGKPIRAEAFTDAVTVQNTFPQCQQQGMSNDALAECILNATNSNPNAGNNTVSNLVSPMKPFTKAVRVPGPRPTTFYVKQWIGMGPEQFAANSSFKNDETVTYFNNPVPSLPVVVPTTFTTPALSLDSTMKAISKKQSSRSRNKTEFFNAMGASAGNSETTLLNNGSIETQTFSDLNGDGYPDMVYPESVQFTNSVGGLDDMKLVASQDFPTSSDSYQKTNSAGFSYNGFSANGRIKVNGSLGTSTEPNSSMPWSGGASLGGGITSYYNSSDYGRSFWMDINGDGLPDRIIKSGGTVMLNLGKSLSGNSYFENMLTYRSHPVGSTNVSIGGNLGSFVDFGALSNLGFGISVSLGGSASKGSADVVHEDINSDGLIDIVEIEKNETTQVAKASVRYNLGNKFTSAIPLLKESGNLDFTNESGSYNGSFSFGGHFMFNIGPITLIPPFPVLILFIKAGAGATANLGINVSDTKKAFKDMNGDGFVDLVEDTDNGFIVNYSLIGKTNKLKTVTHRLTKGQYTVDYKFTRPGYQDPYPKLVVSEVKVLNPDVFSADYTRSNANNDMVTRYTFENSKYDRRERDNFGFEKVTREEIQADNTVYRKTVDIYYNTSYFLNGLLKESQLLTGSNALLSKVNYNYKIYKFKNNTTQVDLTPMPENFDTGGTEGRKMATVLLNTKTTTKYEIGGEIQTIEKMTYNDLGKIIGFQYNSPTKTYNSVISYWAGLGNNITGIPKEISVYNGTGTSNLIRRRKTSDPDVLTGKIGKYAVYDGSQDTETEFTYTSSGNISTVKYPPNELGQRYTLSYQYDSATGKNVSSVSDTFGYTSTATYHPYFDAMEKSTDITGNTIDYTYDEYGRIVIASGPNEAGGVNPTILHDYYYDHYGIPNSNQDIKIFRARTSHYDIDHPSNRINTDSYSDFMGRVIQVKKDVEIDGVEQRSVSGRSVFDVFGRSVQQFHPHVQGLQNDNLSLSQSQYFSGTSYDHLDRVLTAKDEDGNIKSISFRIENGRLKTTEEFYNMKTETFTNVEGKVVDKNDYLGSTPLNTHFKYNDAGEVTSVTDPEGIETSYDYDLSGKRTGMTHPDKGRTDYEYDLAGNLIKLRTANLANEPVNYIQYKYDHNRLTDIVLPNLPSGAVNPNNVHYEYMPANSGNNTGKVIIKNDGTGYTYYDYGKMGEVTSEVRRVYGYNIQTMEFRTDYVYDSWNRVKKIVYPDQEQLFYSYDLGGNLKTVSNGSYSYIQNINYDLYEQRKQIKYGNGTQSDFSYKPTSRRLSFHSLADASSNLLLANSYNYDPVGNVIKILNSADVSPNKMGGNYLFNYGYDTLNRLIGTEGSQRLVDKAGDPVTPGTSPYQESNSGFKMKMNYNNSGGIIGKDQEHKVDQNLNELNTYSNEYKYMGGTHKLESVYDYQTGADQQFEYDYNGNVTMHRDRFGLKQIFWDEQDRMKAFYNEDSGIYQYNAYDDKGERTIKYSLAAGSQLYQNGELIDPGSIMLHSYKLYPNSYVTVTSDGQYTKHYFEGSTRFASRIQDGNDIFIPLRKSAGQNTVGKEPDPASDFKTYLEKSGVEGNITSELGAKSGGGAGNEPGLYYLHGDHLGSATFVTDHASTTTQFFLNLPFGETMIEQMTGVYDNRYKFNAKELDKETDLYYYGARYYNPRLSIWYGVDPLAVYNPVAETEFYGDGQHNGGVFYWGNLNPYIYTYQNPIKWIDPNGKQVYFMTPGTVNKEGANLLVDFIPGVGDAKGVVEGVAGRDALGNKLSWGNRLLSIALLSELRSGSNFIQTVNQADKTLNALRKITRPKWGSIIADYGTSAMKHIEEGHFFNSRAGRASSRFSQKFSNTESVKGLVQEAVAKGKHIGGEDNYKVIHTFDEVIGTTSGGKKTKTLQVYLDKSGNVKNAYPIPTPKK